MDKRKELKEQYKHMKPDMGLFIIKSNLTNKCYIEGTQDLKGTINSTKFKLGLGTHMNKELQNEWKALGETSFIVEILENLKYQEDESKSDYSEELIILIMIWEEKLQKEGKEFYKNK
jgi:hypothetical protein